MIRIFGAMTAAMLTCMSGSVAAIGRAHERIDDASASLDVAALLAAAQGAPPLICSLAANSLRGWGWGGRDAPATPLSAVVTPVRSRDVESRALPVADIERLVAALDSADPCVRELSVRILGGQEKNQTVVTALLTRLSSSDATIREVAAFGLGLMQPPSAVDPLLGALRDVASGVRANAAWALGRHENGRALAALVGLFNDASDTVREAAVVAAGRIDSNSTVGALLRVLQNDSSPNVRRVAAWALGQHGAREANDAMARQLDKEPDASVREMIVWALGNTRARGSASVIANAMKHDSNDAVRETATWALAEIGERSAVTALADVLSTDASARVRGTAAWAVGQLRDSGHEAPSALVRVLKDESDDVRLKAAWALGQIGDPASMGGIRDALRAERSPQVRKALIRALVRTGGRSEEALTELLNSSDATVREAAVRGLAGAHSFDPWPWPWPRPRPFP